MITLHALLELASSYGSELDQPVEPLAIGTQTWDTDTTPLIMGVINLSRESTYRESVAVSIDSALRKARIMVAQGAHIVDIGAESSQQDAPRVRPEVQQATLVPLVRQLTSEGITVSVESYDAEVVAAALDAGAQVINLTGSVADDVIFELAAAHHATIIMCHLAGATARDLDHLGVAADPFALMSQQFGARLERARSLGATRLAIDPGIGFSFLNSAPLARAQYQAAMLLQTFRLRHLGVPICQALPHAFDVFEEEYRLGEPFFAVLAHLGRTGIYRVHETAQVRTVLRALHVFSTNEQPEFSE